LSPFRQAAIPNKAEERPKRGIPMGLTDKAKNAAQDATGKIKENAGKASDDESLEAEGRRDQAGADLKQAGEKVKDAFKD